MAEAIMAALDDSSAIAIIDISADGRIINANRTMMRLLKSDSIDELESTNFKRDVLLASSEWEPWRHSLTHGQQKNVEIKCRASDGKEIILSGDIRSVESGVEEPVTLLGIFTDVTASRQLHRALQRMARVEAIGCLASGIAHDVNNLLTVLVGNLYLVAESVRADATAFDKVRRARNAAKRGADLMRQLLTFARGGQVRSTVVNLEKLIANLEPLLQRAIGSEISLEARADEDVWPIDANAAQIDSIIVNLTINARDAISGGGVGKIVIKASNSPLTLEDSVKYGLTPGEYVRISVADNGSGIPAVLHEKVFEPFFSTKREGEGTGLGLSMVRWTCEQAGGAAVLKSRPGRGTSVSLLLPRSSRSSADTTLNTMPLSVLPTGDESVLVLATDEEIRMMVQQILETLGYSVQLSANPEESFNLISRNAIDLAILDSSASETGGGRGVASLLRRFSDSVRTLVLVDSKCMKACATPHQLIKPFSLQDLATAVRRALDGENRR